MADHRVFAPVVLIDETPQIAGAGRLRGEFLQLHLRQIVDVVAGESAREAVGAGGGREEFGHDDARQHGAIGVEHDEAVRDEIVAELRPARP